MALTPKQTAFVREYLVDLNATQAAVRAGYSRKTAEKIGSENLRKPEVAKALQAAMDKRAERVELTADLVLRELLSHALFDPATLYDADGRMKKLAEIPLAARRSITALETDELGEDQGIGITRKVKYSDRLKALELLGRHLKLFTDRLEVK